jgi:UDP-GlcNAc:undecaprenyl-phosphate GlcNAc-1-phosphate transferase
LTPAVIKFARAIKAVDRGGYRKIYEGAMPLLGGLAIAVPFLAVCVLGMLRITGMMESIGSQRRDLLVLAAGGAAILAVGIFDDAHGMRARTKLFYQCLIALFVAMAGNAITSLELPLVGRIELGQIAGTVLAMLWIIGIINSVNLVDGMDGLASGLALIAAIALGILAALNGSTFVVLLSITLAGSLLAFLMFNFHPARIFLGDTGSMFLGYALATIALMGSYKTPASILLLAPALALGVPIFETMISIVRRYLRGKPLFSGDQEHTHHRLLKKGFTQRQAAVILYAAALSCLVAAVLFQVLAARARSTLMPISLYLTTVAGLAWVAGYLRVPEVLQQSRRRSHNMVLSAFSRYASLCLGTPASVVSSAELMRIARRELGLRYLEAWFEQGPTQIVSSGRMRFRLPAPGAARLVDGPAFVAGPDGFVTDEELAALPVDMLKTMRVHSAGGYGVIVRYQFYKQPEDLVAQDVAACLANLFEQTRFTPPALAAGAVHTRRPRFLALLGLRAAEDEVGADT